MAQSVNYVDRLQIYISNYVFWPTIIPSPYQSITMSQAGTQSIHLLKDNWNWIYDALKSTIQWYKGAHAFELKINPLIIMIKSQCSDQC